MNRSIVLNAAILVSLAAICGAQEQEPAKIREGMTKLAPLIGEWKARWKFHGPNGITEQTGRHSVGPVLEGTYL